MWAEGAAAGATLADSAPEIVSWVSLNLALRARGGAKPVRVWGSNVEELELRLRPWGLSGLLRFWVINDETVEGDEADEVRALVLGDKPIEIELHLLALHPSRERGKLEPRPLIVKGVVLGREVLEQGYATAGAKALTRRYSLSFADPMAVYWGQHYPQALYTKKTFTDVLTEQRGQLFPLTIESQAAKAACPLIYLGHEPGMGGSFYDLVAWYADENGAELGYDPGKGTYRLADRRPDQPRKGQLDHEDVAAIGVRLAEVPRYQVRVQNGDARGAATSKSASQTGLAPLFQDVLVRAPLPAACQARLTRESRRLRPHKDEIHVAFAHLPLVFPQPGDTLDLRKDKQWSLAGLALPESALAEELRYVAIDLSLRGARPTFDGRAAGEARDLRGRMLATLEPLSEVHVALPPYAPPPPERLLEGYVVSDVGTEKQETHDVLTDKETSLDRYRIKIPLFANQIVEAPFHPGGQPGQFYFPAYRGARVLVGLSFAAARMEASLDWRTDGRLPKDQQGNQLLMGKEPDDGTAMRVSYRQDRPVFTLQRLNKQDRQTLELHEGGLRIEVREDKPNAQGGGQGGSQAGAKGGA